MKHISDQQQDPFYEQIILLLSLLPVLKEKKVILNQLEKKKHVNKENHFTAIL